jgi:hypothetical protein
METIRKPATEQTQSLRDKQFGPNVGTKFTKENAAEMARRRWMRASLESAPLEDRWRLVQRDATRDRIKAIEKEMDEEKDPKTKCFIVKSWSQMCEEERKWDERPLPGSRRPTADKPYKAPSSIAPLDS